MLFGIIRNALLRYPKTFKKAKVLWHDSPRAISLQFSRIFQLASPLGIQPKISHDVCKIVPTKMQQNMANRSLLITFLEALCQISDRALAVECPGVHVDRDCLRRSLWSL